MPRRGAQGQRRCNAKKFGRRKLPRRPVEDRRDRIESGERPREFGEARGPRRFGDEVGLGDDEPVGERDLPLGLGPGRKRRPAVDRVDQGDDATKLEPDGEPRIGEERVEDRRGLGEAGRLEHDPVERRQRALVAPIENVAERLDEIAAQRATDAAAADQDGVARQALVEQMIEPDLAPFVDDDERTGKFREREAAG